MNTPIEPGQVDVVVVQKQTALERYTRRALNVDFLEYVEQGGGSLADLKEAHDSHVETRAHVLSVLARRGLSVLAWNLDELSSSGLPFYLPTAPRKGGLLPRGRLVISLGGDGTLLHASHYVGADVTLFGVNSCPAHSVGALCAARKENFEGLLDDHLAGHVKIARTRRLLVTTSDGHRLPLALNDVLLCNQHPAATSRYQISVLPLAPPLPPSSPGTGNQETSALLSGQTESQLSSGLWIAAPAGTSAVIHGYGLPTQPLEGRAFQLAVREPYLPFTGGERTRSYAVDKLILDGDTQWLSLFCRMRAGLVCVDGPDNGVMLGFGARVEISMPATTELSLVAPRGRSARESSIPDRCLNLLHPPRPSSAFLCLADFPLTPHR